MRIITEKKIMKASLSVEHAEASLKKGRDEIENNPF